MFLRPIDGDHAAILDEIVGELLIAYVPWVLNLSRHLIFLGCRYATVRAPHGLAQENQLFPDLESIPHHDTLCRLLLLLIAEGFLVGSLLMANLFGATG